MKLPLFRLLSLIFCFSLSQYALAFSCGVTSQKFYDSQRDRHLPALVFYPTQENTPETFISRNEVWDGYYAIQDAKIEEGKYPLLIIAHGSGGNYTNQGFLATALARKGFIVVAANHPGSTTGDSVPKEGLKMWQQTEDISFILDQLLSDNAFTPAIDKRSLGVLGHSKGGMSALSLAGAKLNLDKMELFCNEVPEDPNCYYYNNNDRNITHIEKGKFNASYQDERFHYFISLDSGGSTAPEYGTFYDLESLKTINKPILIVGAEKFRADKNDNLNNDYLFSLMNPNVASYFEPKGSTHFSYVIGCTEFGKTILAEEGEPFVCMDNRDRKEIQQELINKIMLFIESVSENKK